MPLSWKCVSVPSGNIENPLSLPLVVGRLLPKVRTPNSGSNGTLSIPHKYVSRLHFTTELTPTGDIEVTQQGKNPTFWGPQAMCMKQGDKRVFSLNEGEIVFFFPKELALPKIVMRPDETSIDTSNCSISTKPPLAFSLSEGEDTDDDDVSVPHSKVPYLLEEALVEKQQKIDSDLSFSHINGPVRVVPVKSPEISAGESITPAADIGSCRGSNETEMINKNTIQLQGVTLNNKTPAVKSVPVVSKGVPHKAVCWEWKYNLDGSDNNPKNWKSYSKETTEKLEAAFRDSGGLTSSISIDNTYSVSFDEVNYGMVQYRTDDPYFWRSVRRRGGDRVSRPNRKRVRIIPIESDTSKKEKKQITSESDSDSDTDDSDDDESGSSSASSSSSSESSSDSDD